MENEEMLEQTNDTENAETQTAEENEEGIELTDTAEPEGEEPEKEEEKPKTLKELLKENEGYQEEFNDMMSIRLRRQKKEYDREISKYKNTENLLNAGLGTKNLDEADGKLREFWEEQGIKLPEAQKPGLTDRENHILGEAEAKEILELGLDEARNEANRLADIGFDNLNEREKTIFTTLSSKLHSEKQKSELKELGLNDNLLEDKEFMAFKDMFAASTSIKDIVKLYNKSNKTKYEKMGSMKSNDSEKKIKDFYTKEEVEKMTDEELDDPKVWDAVMKSRLKW